MEDVNSLVATTAGRFSCAEKKERGDKLVISLLLVENIHRGDPMENVEVDT